MSEKKKYELTAKDITAELPDGVDFKILDRGDKFELQHAYIEEKKLYQEVCDAVDRLGGKTPGEYYSGAAHYEIPKRGVGFEPGTEIKPLPSLPVQMPQSEAAEEIPTAKPSEEYSIKDSLNIGYLYPVLKDAQGNIIDGFHRLNEDAKWPVKKLDQITNPLELAIARLVANVCRRDVPAEEKTEWLRQIATMSKWTPKEMAEKLPVSYTWVMKYLPDKFKGRPGAGPTEAYQSISDMPVTRRVTQVPCENCGTATSTPQDWHGHTLCPLCVERAETNPEYFLKKFKLLRKAKAAEEKPVKPKKFKPQEKWEHRVAQMKPQHSKMEQAIQVKLHNDKELRAAGWKVRGPRKHCLMWTEDDGGLVKGDVDIPYYLDHEETHKTRREKDLQLRSMLEKRVGRPPIVASYKAFTKEETGRVFNEIKKVVVQ